MSVKNLIFVSYRRIDSNDVTGRISDRLKAHFKGKIVFRDVDSIPIGDDFHECLNQAVASCKVLVAVIGSTWLEELYKRLAKPEQHDWVKAEIETALSKDPPIPVIPLLVGGAKMPKAEELPDGLKPLARRNAAKARPDSDFDHDMQRLIQRLEEAVGEPPTASPLSPRDTKALREKIQSVYRSHARLELFVEEYIERGLALWGREDELDIAISKLIRWAEGQGRLPELLNGLREDVPDRQDIQNLCQHLLTSF